MSSSKRGEALALRLAAAVRTVFETLRREHAEEHFYFFALFTNAEGDHVRPGACSEESLARFVQRRRDPGERRSAEAWTKDFRFAADPAHGQDELEDFDGGAALHEACFGALAQLDREGFFGSGAERDKVLLNVVHDDMSDELWFAHAERLNPSRALDAARPFLTLHVPSGNVRTWGAAVRDVNALALSADRSLVLYAGSSGGLGILDTAERTPLFEAQKRAVYWAGALAPDGSECFLGVRDDGVLVVEARTGKRVRLLAAAKPSALALSPAGDRLAVSSFSDPVRVIAPTDGEDYWSQPDTRRASLAFSPCGKWLACATPNAHDKRGATLHCFDAATGETRWRTKLGRGTDVSVAWSSAGDRLLAATSEGIYRANGEVAGHGSVAWFAASNGQRSLVLPWTHPVHAVACAPAGTHIGLCAGPVLVALDHEGVELARGTGGQGRLRACVFVSDQRLLAAGEDVNSGPALLELELTPAP